MRRLWKGLRICVCVCMVAVEEGVSFLEALGFDGDDDVDDDDEACGRTGGRFRFILPSREAEDFVGEQLVGRLRVCGSGRYCLINSPRPWSPSTAPCEATSWR